MSRKNPFANLDMASISSDPPSAKPGYGMTGAAKTVVRSIEEMAANTRKLMDGETIIELSPLVLDSSFAADRLSDKDHDYEELKKAIKDFGQLTPILVRPHASDSERYMVVFGHRRAQVAQELGINVKAIVKKLDDAASAVAQGQENSARSNLSFIERAFFAQNLLASGMTKDVIKSSIGIDDAMLSRMLSVIETIPVVMLRDLGASKTIGRDKWLSLRQLMLNPAYLTIAQEYVAGPAFQAQPEDKRFDDLHGYLKRYKARSEAKAARKSELAKIWTSADDALSLTMNAKAKRVAIEFSRTEARPFGEWISNNLDRLYDEYRVSKTTDNGD